MASLIRCDLQLDGCDGDVPHYSAYRLDIELRLPSDGQRAQFGPAAGQLVPSGRITRVVDACGACVAKLPGLGVLFGDEEKPPAQLDA